MRAKVWVLEKYTKWNTFFCLIKVQKLSLFFYLHFPDYMAHDITKDFLKNRYFENMTAGFLLRCQNLLLQITPKMMHFQAWKKFIFTNNAF